MGFFSIIKALTSGEVKEVEIDFKLDTNDKAGDSDDVYVEDNKLVISREKLGVMVKTISFFFRWIRKARISCGETPELAASS
ncbi:MAG: hypothetical protein K6E70_09460 [Butyrivibrio sp.]|nr:hypothetical protein [Butyrivibrio sp.]